jgi:hypothetical protein
MSTLQSGATTITLPDDLIWIDRYTRSLVSQNVEIAANGAAVIEEFQQIGAYPITLAPYNGVDTWVPRSTVDALQTLSDSPQSSPMTFTYNDGTVVLVRFRRDGNTPPVDAQPVYPIFPEDGTSPYFLTLRLIQASA